jgi:hypothetical protein
VDLSAERAYRERVSDAVAGANHSGLDSKKGLAGEKSDERSDGDLGTESGGQ